MKLMPIEFCFLSLFFLPPFYWITSLDYTALSDQNEESGNMLKKAVTAQFEALPRNLYGSTIEHHEEPQSE